MRDRSGKSAVRSRTGRSARAVARGCAAVLALLALLAHPGAGAAQVRTEAGPLAVLLDVEGAIGPATTGYLRQGFEAAAERSATLIIVRMNTPGGLDSAMRDIVRAILASPIPVVAWVAPRGARAASAGTYILYASHLAAMAPGTNLGAATPVPLGGGGGDETADAMTAKIVNDAVAYIRSLAELHGRNADWAEQAVREAASLPAGAALDRDVVEIVAADLDGLLARMRGRVVDLGEREVTIETRGIEVVAMEPDWRVRLLGILTDPNVAFILMLIGVYGIIFELVSPGAIFPGVVGAISLLLGLFALNLLPINHAGAGLVLLGIALMTAEAFVPSFGTLGIGGAIAFAAGALFMFEEVPGLELSLTVVLTATAASAALLAVMLAAVVRAHRREVASGDPALIGGVAEVVAWSGRRGQVHVHGERWQARSPVPLSPGDRVRVTGREKLTLTVEPETPVSRP